MRVRKGLIAGVVLLLFVDVVWVGSAGISRHLFHDEHYDKPLFWTYFKTTLFSLYLSGFLFWRPWQRLCLEGCKRRESGGGGRGGVRVGVGRTVGVGVGRVWLRMWGKGNGDSVAAKNNNNQEGSEVGRVGREVESSSCGIDETTGQCTPGDNDICRQPLVTAYRNSCEGGGGGVKGEECGDEDITSLKLGSPHQQEEDSDTSPLSRGRDREEEEEGEGEGSEICPSVVERRRNRHTRVVDGRVLFRPVGSLNGDTCRVNSPPPVCTLDPCMLGPSEFKPLNCALSEEDRKQTGPLSPCSTKCCKVRFNRTIEVREVKSEGRVRDEPAPLMPVWKVASLSLVFGIVWFFANYLYALALVSKSVALVNTLSSMSSVFVMVMAALPLLHREPGDKITLSRVLVSLLSVVGGALVSISDSTETDHRYWSAGALLALASAFLYAVYLVLLKKLVQNPDSLELPMFFGFVGLFDSVLLLPLVLVWHYTGLEPFQWPPSPNVWTLLLVNGFVGTVISELLWLGGVFLTSPLVGTLSLALVTPLSITYSVFVGQQPFSVEFFLGALLVVVCFILVTVLDHFGSWDPLWALIKTAVSAARNHSAHRGYLSLSEESKRLIEHEDDSAIDQLSFNVS